MSITKRIGIILGPLLFVLTIYFFNPEDLSKEGIAVLATALWVAVWWITEAVPIATAALLPIVLFPISGGLSLSETTASYGHKFVFLYLGGFMIAIAIEKWNLHKRIALSIINAIGTNIQRIILGFMVATGFISMWISNTATAVMMLPIGMAIVTQLNDNPNTKANENLIFGKALMLGIAYSASIGGIATLIGTPPNLVLAGVVQETYGYEITFSQWFIFGLPIAILLLFLCWWYLTRIAFKFPEKKFPGGREEINKQLVALGRISYEEKAVALRFFITAFGWVTHSFLLKKWIPQLDDTIIAVFFSILLFVIPSSKKNKMILQWEDTIKLPWGIILLFGGGMALASGFERSGLAHWIGSQMHSFQEFPTILFIFLLIAVVNFLTEITSNLATTAMLLPVLAPMAISMDMHPFVLMVATAVAASCAFMLPVATPPNAVVFGSGYLQIPDMVKKGIVMNIISIGLLSAFVYWILPLLWNLTIEGFPTNLLTP